MFQKLGFRTVDILNLSYLLLSIFLSFVFYNKIENFPIVLLSHFLLCIGILFFLVSSKGATNKVLLFLKDWYSPMLFTFYYEQTYTFAKAIYRGSNFDSVILKIEEAIFGCQPSLLFSIKFPNIFFSEFVHFGYAFYYLFIPLTGAFLYFTGHKSECRRFIFGCSALMLFCYVIFIVFPVAGPYWTFNASRNEYRGFIFVKIIDYIVLNAEIPNAAFPSSHVALALFVLLSAIKFRLKISLLLIPAFIGLTLATVYIKAHYVIDIPFGILVGVLFFIYSDRFKSYLEKRLDLPE